MKQVLEIEVPKGKRAVLRDDKIIYEDIVPKLPGIFFRQKNR